MRKLLRSKALRAFRHFPERQDEPLPEKPPRAGDPLLTQQAHWTRGDHVGHLIVGQNLYVVSRARA